ncbi:MAG: alpha-glucan family phosphorylase [Gammaproteobacteria bacterium]|nr:alpha-glucan family phosphorylase [Gammaproteobacteria bacterium]
MSETRYRLEVRPRVPQRLEGLNQLATDLMYTWDRSIRGLFYRLDPPLWEACHHNPKLFLRRVAQRVLDEAAEDQVYVEEYHRVLSGCQTYREKIINKHVAQQLDIDQDLVAYFCAEFGFHESFPIYSGGLGILAGDHCKAASDLGVPFIAVGLLYRQGYFSQSIDGNGNQIAQYNSINFDELLVTPATDTNGVEISVEVEINSRPVKLKVWQADAGHIHLYLLDSDLEVNTSDDRSITFQLYGGDKTTRIQQEMVLGIGGVRALRALGITPTIWHINEGHAAFQIVERCREQVKQGLDFDSALEYVAGCTIFTTHTPVPAGHDIFDAGQMTNYFTRYVAELGIDMQEFLSLGSTPNNHGTFNMTALALRGSRFHNGVSCIHGGVASQMEGYIWPQIPHDENPITYITNGVHVQTFLAREWVNLFDMRFREWRSELLNAKFWHNLDAIPDHRFWSLRQELKTQMLEDVYHRTLDRFHRSGHAEAIIGRISQYISHPDSNVLVLGFARRFATYKRATLMFNDPQRLARLLNDPQRPVLIVFAGKAHPRDLPGQELIRTIHEYSLRPEFIGKLILLEGYDMALARKLVSGVDVWVNTPQYPLEASGTSGQKAAINGVINLSVLDGWWGEGYNGLNGWAIHPHEQQISSDRRDREESGDLLNILENEIIPTFFNVNNQGYSPAWVRLSKESMKSCIPTYNSQRMVVDYVNKCYGPACRQHRKLAAEGAKPARILAQWKQRIRDHWKEVSLQRIDSAVEQVYDGEVLPIRVSVNLNGLVPEDVIVECILSTEEELSAVNRYAQLKFTYVAQQQGNHIFELKLQPQMPGLSYYKIRIYPYHELLSHPFELGFMRWI